MPVEKNSFDSLRPEIALQQALKTIGITTLQVAKPLCPVDTGNLRASHKYKVNVAQETVDVGVTAEYGGHVHNGTSRQKAQPWLRDAVEANKNSIFEGGINAYKVSLGGEE